ncbi:MAG: OmpA family protein, partial [Luminiphilus sp.]
EKYNLSLSTRRAAAVRDYLLSRGVSVQRVYIEGRGESDPLVNNSTESGRAKNRRVEIELIPAKQS